MKRTYALFISGLCLAPVFLGAMGCAGDQPATPIVEDYEPIGTQLMRAVPSLRDERFNALLDFESADDGIFCNTVGGTGAISTERTHTGRSAFKIDSSTKTLVVKLSALMEGRPFPGDWTLVGGYFYSQQPIKIKVGLDPAPSGSEPREVDVPAGSWTPVFAELPVSSAQQETGRLAFDLLSPHGTIWCDDVLLIDNFKLLTAPSEESASASQTESDVAAGIMPPWTVTRRGLDYLGTSPGRFNFQLVTREASPTGWTVDDANPMRAMFHSDANASNPPRTLAIYADGRAFWNDQFKPMSIAARDPALLAGHLSPAHIEVTEGMGRVDRNTPGDANNDGYNETTGSYRIIATGPRIELRFIPGKVPVLSPILEISGLPFGKALITLEGRLVEQSARTSRGSLLVELPAKIDRPVTVDIRIEE
jgi:hypothetical protein